MSQPDLFGTSHKRATKPRTNGLGRPLRPDESELMKEAAALIRTHLWLGSSPPPPPHPSDVPWTMGRDLDIWQKLVRAGWEPPLLNAAITVVRSLMSAENAERSLTMRIFWFKGATPLVERAVGEWCKRETREQANRPGLPPTVRDIMRRMIG